VIRKVEQVDDAPLALASVRPQVSVCVPMFNGAPYLSGCLDSILTQTLHDWELLLVDDSSHDATFEIARDYARRDPRIQAVRNPRNLGLVGNWNRCMELARGEWIKFVFQDDLIRPRCLEALLQAVEPGDVLVFCRRDILFEDDASDATRKYYASKRALVEKHFPRAGRYTARDFCTVTLTKVGDNFVGEPTAVMLHRSVREQFGPFNPDFIVSCDVEYWTRVGIETGVVHVPEELASFRVHPAATSATSRVDRKYRMDVLDDVLMLHEAAYSPRYRPLREAARIHEPPTDLEREFRDKAAWAYGTALRAANDATRPDRSLLTEWDALAARYAGLRSAARRSTLARHWQRLLGRGRAVLGHSGTEQG